MNTRNDWFEDLQRNISDMIAKSPAGDIERNVRAMMTQTFSRLDLITREEFDIQKELLERLIVRVSSLEQRIQELEGVAANESLSSATVSAAAEAESSAAPSAAADASASSMSPSDSSDSKPQ